MDLEDLADLIKRIPLLEMLENGLDRCGHAVGYYEKALRTRLCRGTYPRLRDAT